MENMDHLNATMQDAGEEMENVLQRDMLQSMTPGDPELPSYVHESQSVQGPGNHPMHTANNAHPNLSDTPGKSSMGWFKIVVNKLRALFGTQPEQIRGQEDKHAAELQDCDAYIQHLQHQIADLSKRHEKLEAMAIGAQNSALQSMLNDSRWTPKEDRQIRDELSKLQERIRLWAKGYSTITPADISDIPVEIKDNFIRLLKGYCGQSNWESFIRKTTMSVTKIPMLLIHALLAKSIFDGMFRDPFFMFTEIRERYPFPMPGQMKNIYIAMCKVHEGEAHTWRSQTLRILCASAEAPLPKRTRALGSFLEAEFLNGCASIFLRQDISGDEIDQRNWELRTLYQTSVELALSLWTQRTYMECIDQRRLDPFMKSDPSATAHRLHNLDEDDERLDGKDVLLVVQPLIVAYGNEDAENYDCHKIWSPATVVVDEMS